MMNIPELIFLPHDIDIQRVVGEVPKLRVTIEVRDTNHSEGLERWVQVNRISLDVELHGANNYGSSSSVGSLGTFNCTEPTSMMLGFKSISFYSNELYCHRKDVRNTG